MSVTELISSFKRQVRQLHRRSFSDPGRATHFESNVLFNRTRSEVFLAELPIYGETIKRMSYINYLTNHGPIPKFIHDPTRRINAHVWTISNEDKGMWVQQKLKNLPTLFDQVKEERCSTSHWQRFSLHEKTLSMKKAVLWKNQETDNENLLIFLHEDIFRNLMTYHDVEDGTIIPKKELVPAMWEHRIEGGEELHNVTEKEVNEVFASGMDISNEDSGSTEAHTSQEVQNKDQQEEKELEVQRQIMTRKQKNIVSKEVKEAIQTQSLENKVVTLEKKLAEVNKNLRKAKNDAQSSQNEYLREHAERTEAQDRVKTLDKENKAVNKKLENRNRDIEQLQYKTQEKIMNIQELKQDLQETKVREQELRKSIEEATSEALQRQEQVQDLQESLIRVRNELASANGEEHQTEATKERLVELEQELVNRTAEHERVVESIRKKNEDILANQFTVIRRTELERNVLSAQMEVMRRDLPEGTEEVMRKEVEDTKKNLEAQTEENRKLKEYIRKLEHEKLVEGENIKKNLTAFKEKSDKERIDLREQVSTLEMQLQNKSYENLELEKNNETLSREVQDLRSEVTERRAEILRLQEEKESGENWEEDLMTGRNSPDQQGTMEQVSNKFSQQVHNNHFPQQVLNNNSSQQVLYNITSHQIEGQGQNEELQHGNTGSIPPRPTSLDQSQLPNAPVQFATMEQVNQAIENRVSSPVNDPLLVNQSQNIVQLIAETSARTMQSIIPSVMENCKKVMKDRREGASNEDLKFDPFLVFTAEQQGKGLDKWFADLEQRFGDHWTTENKTTYAQKHLDKSKESLKNIVTNNFSSYEALKDFMKAMFECEATVFKVSDWSEEIMRFLGTTFSEWCKTKKGVYLISNTKDRWDAKALTPDERTIIMNGLAKVVPRITLQPYSNNLGSYKIELLEQTKFMDIINNLKSSEVFDTVNWKSFNCEKREGKTRQVISLNTLRVEDGPTQLQQHQTELQPNKKFKKKFQKYQNTGNTGEGMPPNNELPQNSQPPVNQPVQQNIGSGSGRNRGKKFRGRGRGSPANSGRTSPASGQQRSLPAPSNGNQQQNQAPPRGRGGRGTYYRGRRGNYRGRGGQGRGNAGQQPANVNVISQPTDLNQLYQYGGYVQMPNGSWTVIQPPQYQTVSPLAWGGQQTQQNPYLTNATPGPSQAQQRPLQQNLQSQDVRVSGIGVGQLSPAPSSY